MKMGIKHALARKSNCFNLDTNGYPFHNENLRICVSVGTRQFQMMMLTSVVHYLEGFKSSGRSTKDHIC